jgi:hypothetical protein
MVLVPLLIHSGDNIKKKKRWAWHVARLGTEEIQDFGRDNLWNGST